MPPIEQIKRTELLKRRFSRQSVRRNPRFDFPHLSGLLETDEGAGLTKYFEGQGIEDERENVFVLSLVDEKQPQNSLMFGEWPDGAIRILITASLVHVQVFQAADGKCALDCAASENSIHRDFASAIEVATDPYFRDTIAPYLKKFGIVIPNADRLDSK